MMKETLFVYLLTTAVISSDDRRKIFWRPPNYLLATVKRLTNQGSYTVLIVDDNIRWLR